ncbi:MAG TPA: MATE family efflux transporter [Polyangiaceae bacterium]
MKPGDRAAERIVKGPLGLEVARFGTPLALGMGLQTVFNLVDAYLLGHLDSELAGPALGAIGICDQLAALGTIVSYGLTTATTAIVSRRHGEGDRAEVERVAWQSLLVVSTLSLVFGLLGAFGGGILLQHVIGAKGRVAELGTDYLRVMMGGSFSIFLLLHLTSLARALGSSKTPVGLLVVANVLNIVLAVLMIYGPGPAPAAFAWGPPLARALGIPRMELMGAAWATLIARSLALVPAAIFLVRRFGLFGRASWRPFDSEIVRSIWQLGWPSSAQLVVRISAMLMVHSLVARAFTTDTDQTATTALGIVFRLETMAFFVGLGWGSAAQTFIGVNLGAGNVARAKAAGYYAAVYNAAMMGSLALLYLLYGREIVMFFDAEPSVVSTALSYFARVGISYVGLGVGIVLGAAMQGAGATRRAFLLDSSVVLLFQLPASLLVAMAPGARFEHLCVIVAITYVGFAIVHGASYRQGGFLKAAVN